MSDKDSGQGDESKYPAAELEHLYRVGGVTLEQRILGRELNKVLDTTKYDPETWYVVKNNGVEKL